MSLFDASFLYYRNDAVIDRYCTDHHHSITYGRDVFMQLLKWLYISNELKLQGMTAFITYEIAEIDNMWHIFLLFTKDYETFCDRYFKHFIHHTPVHSKTRHMSLDEREKIFKPYFTLIAKIFGRDTLLAWFKEKKYA